MTAIPVATQRAHTFKSVSDWGETLRFRAGGSGDGPGFDVTGVVSRVKVSPLNEMPSAGGPSLTVLIVHEAAPYNAAEDAREFEGLNIADLRLSVSTLDIATDPGQQAQPRVITRLLDSDEATLHLECR